MSLLGHRIVERQVVTYEYKATSSTENAEILEQLINRTKPAPYHAEWHDLIATPFRYSLPVPSNYQARFRPQNSMTNILYASQVDITAYFEHAYHFLRFRLGMKKIKKTGQRTIFGIKILREEDIQDIAHHPHIDSIMNPSDYSSSHSYVVDNPGVKIIRYPSCRDPEHRLNYAIRDITTLEKKILFEHTISFAYNSKQHSMEWIELKLNIPWSLFEPARPRKSKKPSRARSK